MAPTTNPCVPRDRAPGEFKEAYASLFRTREQQKVGICNLNAARPRRPMHLQERTESHLLKGMHTTLSVKLRCMEVPVGQSPHGRTGNSTRCHASQSSTPQVDLISACEMRDLSG